MAQPVKCVVVGDGAVGKTCVLMSYTMNTFPDDYIPTVFDNYNVPVMLQNHPYHLSLWDTAGQEDYDRLRPLSYPGTDVFLVCFSVDSEESLQHVASKWVPEIKHHAPHVPFLLVGLKGDLRASRKNCLAPEAIRAVCDQVNASAYIECSAKHNENIKKLFDEALRLVVATRAILSARKKKRCSIV
jgi:small GTP-binding protein